MTDDPTDDLISENEAADILGVSPSTMARWRRAEQERNEGERLAPPWYDYPAGEGFRYRLTDVLRFRQQHLHAEWDDDGDEAQSWGELDAATSPDQAGRVAEGGQ